MIGHSRRFVFTVALLAALGGCYEPPEVTLYEPGVYKGTTDPLLEKLRSGERQSQLLERFKTVQTDR